MLFGRWVAPGGRMQSARVVETGDVIVDVGSRLPMVAVDRCPDPLALEAAEEALHRGIVPAVPTPAHALGDAVIRQERAKGGAGVLPALIGVKHQPLGGMAMWQG